MTPHNIAIAHESYSSRIHKAFNQKATRRHVSAILYIAFTLIYLTWRLTTLNQQHLTVSLLYYTAEVFGLILGLVVVFNSWRISSNSPRKSPTGLSVDVFIPTYKEHISIIEKTLEAAANIDYPHTTWVLDDGKRDDVKEVARRLNIKYLVREHNLHAKAGNLNNAIAHSNADFIAVFDADHIPQPEALDKLLGFFESERVAMVQTPQDYYNTDAYQYMNPKNRPGYWHDQSFFYNIALASSNTHNACSCVGTGVVYRRTALNVIGGIPTDTVTEDIHTSLKLHKAGFETVYVNDPVAYGLAATDLSEYYLTRHRWAHGNLAALKKENIFTCPGLTWKQRLSYLSLGLIYLEGWQQIILFTIPIFALIFGVPPFEISMLNVLIILLFPLLSYFLLQEIGGGFTRFWTNEIYSMIRWPVHLAATMALFGKKIKWRSSKKNIKGGIHAVLMIPQLIILVMNIAALICAAYMLSQNVVIGPLAHLFINLFSRNTPAPSVGDITTVMHDGYSVELVAIAGGWALFNIAKVIAFVVKTVRSSLTSEAEVFFNLQLPILLENGITIYSQKISENAVLLEKPLDITPHHIQLVLPTGLLAVKVQNITSSHLQFEWSTRTQQCALIHVLYSPDWYRDPIVRDTIFLTPIDTLINTTRWLIGKHTKRYTWITAILQTSEPSLCLIGQCGSHYSLLCFTTFDITQTPHITCITPASRQSFNVVAHQSIASTPGKGLYGRSYYRYKIIPIVL